MQDLLAPISDAAACGDDLSFSSEFDVIQEMRREDDPTLDQGEWVTELKQADWPGAVTKCEELLAKRSKDIRVAVWLIEALSKTQGFAGLQRGMDVMAGLVERYWDGLHPLPEGEDQEQRIGNLSWLTARGADFVRTVPLTEGKGTRYTLRDYEAARALSAALQRSPEGAEAAADKLTVEKFEKAARDSSHAFLENNWRSAVAAREAIERLQAVLDAKLGNDGPSFSNMRSALDDAVRTTERIARDVGAISGASASAASEDAGASDTSSDSARVSGPIQSRAQALAQLRIVAEYFRRTEPHSPVAYLATKAAQWGDMPLHVWLRSVLKDGGALAHVEELLGIQPEKNEGQS